MERLGHRWRRIWVWVLLCASGFACSQWVPLAGPQSNCDPSTAPQLTASPLWKDSFGNRDGGARMGCLQVRWGETPREGRAILVRVLALGTVFGRDPDSGKYDVSPVFLLPQSASQKAKSFRLFVFGAMVEPEQQEQLCTQTMADPGYDCLSQSEGECWFAWAFSPQREGQARSCSLWVREGTPGQPEPSPDKSQEPPALDGAKEPSPRAPDKSEAARELRSEQLPERRPEPVLEKPGEGSPPAGCTCTVFPDLQAYSAILPGPSAFSPDNQLLVVANLASPLGRQLNIWERDGQGKYTARHKVVSMTFSTAAVRRLRVSHDSRWVAYNLGAEIKVWDLRAIRQAPTQGSRTHLQLKPTRVFKDPEKAEIRALTFHSKGLLITANAKGGVYVWQNGSFALLGQGMPLAGKPQINRIAGDTLGLGFMVVHDEAFSSQGLFGYRQDGRFKELVGTSGSQRASKSDVLTLSFLWGTRFFVMGQRDGLAEILKGASTGSARHQVYLQGPGGRAHRGAVFGASFRRSGDLLATTGEDQKVRLWTLKQRPFSAQLLRELGLPSAGIEVEFSPDGCSLLTSYTSTTSGLQVRHCSP